MMSMSAFLSIARSTMFVSARRVARWAAACGAPSYSGSPASGLSRWMSAVWMISGMTGIGMLKQSPDTTGGGTDQRDRPSCASRGPSRLPCVRDNQKVPARFDVSQVPLQGGYVAKQCPVRAQNDTLAAWRAAPTGSLHASAVRKRERIRGRDRRRGAQAASPSGRHRGTRLRCARGGNERGHERPGSSPILNARLPADLVGRRVGRPDLLIAAPSGGYWPVDIKWHQNLEPASGKGSPLSGLCSSLDALDRDAAILDKRVCGQEARRRPAAARPLPAHARVHRHAGDRRSLGRNHRHRATQWSGTTSTRRSGERHPLPPARRCAPPWIATTSSSPFGSTSSP